ncbi:MAG TPA: hypothetical protein VFZ25_05365 [Chloroflexota bacterium]|nr:hypothetical protein [Chloroflexota bacterium]
MITTVTTTTTVTTVTTAGLATSLAAITLVTLLVLLIQKEIFAGSTSGQGKTISQALNIGIVPLLLAFLMVAAVSIANVLH